MNELKLSIEKIAGFPEKGVACNVFTRRITLADGTEGTLVSCIYAKSENETDVQTFLTDLFEICAKKIEHAQVAEGLLKILSLISQATEDRFIQEEIKGSFIHLFLFKEACYITRYSDKVKLLVFDPPRSVEITIKRGSGPIRAGQMYLVATDRFLSVFDTSTFKHHAEIDLPEIIDGLATDISSEENQSEIAAGFILIKAEPEAEETKETQEETIREDTFQKEGVKSEGEEKPPQDMESFQIQSPKESPKILVKFWEFLKSLPLLVSTLIKRILREVKLLRYGEGRALSRLKRNALALALILLMVLTASAAYTLKKKKDSEKFANISTHLASASEKFEEGLAILELNRAKARKLFVDAEKEVKLVLELDRKNEKAETLASEITTKLKETESLNEIKFKKVAEFSDPISSISVQGNKLIGNSDNKIFEIDISDKSKVEIESPKGTYSAFVFGNDIFIYAKNKIYKVNPISKTFDEVFEKGAVQDIAVFIGNIYLLTDKSIVKLVPIEGGYSEISNYLSENFTITSNSRFVIDGSIWVTSAAKILNFLRGKKQDFEISGLTSPIGEFGAIYTNSDTDNLYVVDMADSALLVINKDGIYQKAYQSPEFSRVTDIVVDEAEGKMYISSGSKVLEADL